MSSPTVRISSKSHAALSELAERSGKTMLAVLDEAVEAYRRKRFFEEANAAYAALQSDPVAWAEFQDEVRDWEGTLLDGLEGVPPPALEAEGTGPQAPRSAPGKRGAPLRPSERPAED